MIAAKTDAAIDVRFLVRAKPKHTNLVLEAMMYLVTKECGNRKNPSQPRFGYARHDSSV
jgi:hypothetical protein